jgi:hypothetical protein
MDYEVEFYTDNIKHTAQVTAPDEETAILLAGMHFSDMDLNTDLVEVLSVTNLGSRL